MSKSTATGSGVSASALRSQPAVRAVCPACEESKPIRRDGLVRKHDSWETSSRCPGSECVPIPVPVPDVDLSPAGRDAARTLERWGFLSLPMRTLLLTTRAIVTETPAPDLGFAGLIRPLGGRVWRWAVSVPIGQDHLERDLAVRGLLAAAHGIDIGDWPIALNLRQA